MYYINSKEDKPDINKLYKRVVNLMDKGIAIQNVDNLYNSLQENKGKLLNSIRDNYGIENPNSYNQVSAYFQKEVNKEIIQFKNEIDTKFNVLEIKNILSICYTNNLDKVDSYIDTISEHLDINGYELNTIKDSINELLNTSIMRYLYKGGKWVTNKEVMLQLSLMGREDAKQLIQYRRVKNYVENVEKFKTYSDGKGYVHPIVSLGKTNRINYSEPALLNIPKDILWKVIAPRKKGNILYSIDIKNQEPSILINMLGIEELKNILRVGEKLYENIFYTIFNKYPNEIERKEFKVSWLALTYGASVKTIQENCKYIDGKAVYKYFNSFKEYKEYKSKCNALAKKNVQTMYTYFNTMLVADELGSRLKRVLLDLPIQGTGADILALLVEHFDEEIETNGLQDYIHLYYTRHDELIVEIEREYFEAIEEEEIINLLSYIFEHQVDDWVPFRVDIKIVTDTLDIFDYTDDSDDD